MYKDIFADRGIIPCEPVPGFNPNGKFYKMNPKLGKGHCWVYQCNPYVTITIMNQVHYEDTCCAFEQPGHGLSKTGADELQILAKDKPQ